MTASAALPYELRPRDFATRLQRSRVRSLGKARQRPHHGKRAAILLAAIAVPAFAAPDHWRDFAGQGGLLGANADAMPFETPDGSFPGSAFYYLSANAAAPLVIPAIHSDAEAALPNDSAPTAIGPAALAMRVDNSGIDRGRALQCLTAAIYYEAASEPDPGQRAVAQVVLNRVAHPAYPNTVCGVVFQGSERRTGCQFSFTCDGALGRVPNRMFWLRAENVARAALSGYVYSPIGLATHYHTVAVHPYWADSLAYLGTIGAHRFYRFGGAAGKLGTFRFAYTGGEPLVGAHPRQGSAELVLAEATVDPVAVQRAYDSGLKAAQNAAFGGLKQAHPVAAPSYTAELQKRGGDALYRADGLPGTTGIRAEYKDSGNWIAQPGA